MPDKLGSGRGRPAADFVGHGVQSDLARLILFDHPLNCRSNSGRGRGIDPLPHFVLKESVVAVSEAERGFDGHVGPPQSYLVIPVIQVNPFSLVALANTATGYRKSLQESVSRGNSHEKYRETR